MRAQILPCYKCHHPSRSNSCVHSKLRTMATLLKSKDSTSQNFLSHLRRRRMSFLRLGVVKQHKIPNSSEQALLIYHGVAVTWNTDRIWVHCSAKHFSQLANNVFLSYFIDSHLYTIKKSYHIHIIYMCTGTRIEP